MAAGVTPKQVYQDLLAAGASTTQAIGILANAIAESGINPEAKNLNDPNGGSYGFVQQNGAGYAGLVTGSPASDIKAQIYVLAQNGGFRAASGSTPAQAAGNFSANYERCQGCQQGGSQYNARVANAATVAGWVTSGQWPTSAGSSSAAGGAAGSGSSSGASSSSACLVGIKGVSVPVLGSLGQACFLSKSEARAILGGALLAGSAFAGLVGLLILAAAGLRSTGAARAAGGALEATGAAVAFVPGAEGAGLALGAAGATARRAAEPGAGGRSLERRRQARAKAAAAGQERQDQERRQAARPVRRPAPSAASKPKAKTQAGPEKQPTPDEVRAQLRARGNQLAPRVSTG